MTIRGAPFVGNCHTPVAGVRPGISVSLRRAEPADIPALRSLVHRAVRGLAVRDYPEPLLDEALDGPLGLDEVLIADGTYFVAIAGDEADAPFVGAGGWSRRLPDQEDPCHKESETFADPRTSSARIRAFFVDPAYAGRGVGALILSRCLVEACNAGFRRAELIATLTGEQLYAKAGFRTIDRMDAVLPSGRAFPVVRMERELRG